VLAVTLAGQLRQVDGTGLDAYVLALISGIGNGQSLMPRLAARVHAFVDLPQVPT
jgi:hypothetical protein